MGRWNPMLVQSGLLPARSTYRMGDWAAWSCEAPCSGGQTGASVCWNGSGLALPEILGFVEGQVCGSDGVGRMTCRARRPGSLRSSGHSSLRRMVIQVEVVVLGGVLEDLSMFLSRIES